MAFPLISHADVRVRNRELATAFYDELLLPLGAKRRGPDNDDDEWTSYYDSASGHHWFGFTVEPAFTPGPTRIAFNCPDRAMVDRLAARLPAIGARNIEPSEDPVEYPALFFEDPGGTKLELVARKPRL